MAASPRYAPPSTRCARGARSSDRARVGLPAALLAGRQIPIEGHADVAREEPSGLGQHQTRTRLVQQADAALRLELADLGAGGFEVAVEVDAKARADGVSIDREVAQQLADDEL